MFVVECPAVRTGRGQRLVTESQIRSFEAVAGGWRLTVACACGERHPVLVPRLGEEVRPAQVVG